MLHELLFVLLGYPGDVFVAQPPTHPTTFAIPSSFPLLHPAEKACLNRLGQLGWTYLQIHQFVHRIKDLKPSTDHTDLHGAYIQALATCIESTLNEYHQDILDIEKRILNKEDEFGQGIVPLSLLTAHLNTWELLLPALYKFITVLQQDPTQYHGCKLFNLLMDQSRTGVAVFRAQIEKMMTQLHNVLYRQLTAWMVYGQWVDPDGEFFIKPYEQQQQQQISGWHQLYVVDYDRIPFHLSHSLVESILFVGKAIATVNAMDKLPISISQYEHSTMLPFTSPTKHASRNKLRIPSEMQKKHLELLLSLYSDKTHPHSPWIYYPQQLTNVVHQVRKSTADWLFSQVLVGDYGLYRYLSSFRHMFLLNYGDLATHFIEACALWRRQSMSTEEHPGRTAMIFQRQEMNALLVKASLGTEAEDQLAGFSLLLEQEKTQEYPFADLLLIDIPLVMTFDLEWPIDLFISPSDLKRYSHLWSFLISLKATQMALNNLWKILRTGEQIESHDERRVWQLRSLMLFWIDTVWNHIQIHVIDAHYQTMIHTISPSMTNKRKSRQNTKLDFEEIQFAHETFLKNTTRGCLLLSHECVKTMYDILKTCLGFCDTMEKISQEGHWRRSKKRKTAPKTASEIVNQWTNATHEQSWLQDVYATQEKFHYLTQHFFALASNQQPEVKSSGRMDVLLMQLDYNQWFSKAIYPTF